MSYFHLNKNYLGYYLYQNKTNADTLRGFIWKIKINQLRIKLTQVSRS